MYHYHHLSKLCNIVLLLIDFSGHVGEGFGDFFGGKARSRLLVEGWGVKEPPTLTPSKQNRRSPKMARSSRQGKWA